MSHPLNHGGTETRRFNDFSEFSASPRLKRFLHWLLPLAFLILFFFFPLSRILSLTFSPVAFTAENLQIAYSALRFTFYQAFLSSLLTLLLGLPSAYLFAHYDFRGKPLLRALTAVPFMLPTVVVAASFNALYGQRGLINTILQFSSSLFPLSSFAQNIHPSSFILHPFLAILLAHVFYNTTIIIRIVGNALSSLDPRLEQTARSLGADSLRIWWNVTLPLLRPSLFAASLLVFLFDFTSFGVILLLGGSRFATLEVEIYLRVLKLPNLPLAALLSVIQLVCTLLFSLLYTRFAARGTQFNPRSVTIKPKSLRQKIFVTALSFLLTAFFLAPLSSLPIRSLFRLEADRGQRGEVQYGFTIDYYTELFVNRRGSVFYVPPIQAAFNSLAYASATVVLSLLFGFPAAFALAKPTRLEKVLDPLIMLPLGSSAVMLGLGFVLSFGAWLTSPLLVPFAHTLVALPFVIRALQPAIASIPERLRQAAASLGASPLEVWRNIDLPILRRATLSAATFAFTVSLGEFGATLLLSRPEYPTIPVAIERFLSQPGGLNYGQAMAMATLLMLLTLVSILLIERFRMPNSGEF
ncbi:MAG: iron ABC transporter permease [Anaerolineales bacterium]|nr:iron ABC transporter permease [Anaerolineales bacterium]NUQ84903.1 iron ABC transporter permease [Anaerolineales bacterium]